MDNLGPALGGKPLHVFWLLDVSGSMSVAGKIDALNDAMRVAVDSVRDAADENPTVKVFARSITFAHDAAWVEKSAAGGGPIPDGVPIEDYVWNDVSVVERGTTEVGRAIDLATQAIAEVSKAGRGLPPALILVSDGKPTDLKPPSYGSALRSLAEHPWGKKASRMAIGIGDDADMDALHQFTGHEEIRPLKAANAEDLRHYLRWASTVVVDEGSRPKVDWEDRKARKTPTIPDGDDVETSPALDGSLDDVVTAPAIGDLDEVPTFAAGSIPPPSGAPRVDIAPPPGIDLPPPPPPPSGDAVW